MTVTRKTVAMAVAAGLLLALNLVDRGTARREVEKLPVLPALVRDEVTRVELTTAAEKIVLRKVDERWRVVAPIEYDADQIQVRSLLNVLRKEVPIDVRVDVGNLEDYGLDASNGVVAEYWTDGELPDVSFTVGLDAAAGSTFIRLSGGDEVYRARVGGRQRFDRPATEWRNKVLLDFEKEEVSGLSVVRQDVPGLALVRGPSPGVDSEGTPEPGPWALDPPAGWDVDQKAVDAMVHSLGGMRAGAILGSEFDGGFDPPLARVEVVLADGEKRGMTIGTRGSEGARFVRVDGQDDVFQVSMSPIERALLPRDAFQDRTVFDFRRDDVDTLSLDRGGTTILIRQDLATKLWNVVQPANVDTDIRQVMFAANTLATLRADGVARGVDAGAAGLERPGMRFGITFVDGSSTALDVGAETTDESGRPARYVRRAGSPQVFVLGAGTLERLAKAFGQT